MPLPSLAGEVVPHQVEFPNVTVTFHLRVIPAPVYSAIIDVHKGEDGTGATVEAVGATLLTHGIASVYSSEVSTPDPWELPKRADGETAEDYVKRVTPHADGLEIWTTWPEWARMSVYAACVAYSTRGPTADPREGSPTRDNADR